MNVGDVCFGSKVRPRSFRCVAMCDAVFLLMMVISDLLIL